MGNLIAKKLSRLPIGTCVELAYGDGGSHHEEISGMITDSDFTANVEITDYEGHEILLDFAIVKGVQVTKSLQDVLKELPSGAEILLAYQQGQTEPDTAATVLENDNEENIEIRTAQGDEIVLNYSLISGLIVKSSSTAASPSVTPPASFQPAPVVKPVTPPPAPMPSPARPAKQDAPAAPAVRPQHAEDEPDDILNLGDAALKELFETLPHNDRQKLSSAFDSFRYGIKINDRSKMTTAANQARQTLFRYDDQDYYWSSEAVRFCGCLLRRVNILDPEVFLIAERFPEAAYACWHEKNYVLAGAYAILALLDAPQEYVNDLLMILSSSALNAEDVSGLQYFLQQLPAGCEAHLQKVINKLFTAKGLRSASDDLSVQLRTLASLMPGKGMEEELSCWTPEEDEAPEAEKAEEKEAEPPKPAAPQYSFGKISHLNWSEHSGTIEGEDGNSYTFCYDDIEDSTLSKVIRDCLRSDLGGKTYMVKFYAEKKAARRIRPDAAPVDRARAIIADVTREDRYLTAFELCKTAVESSDIRRALGDLIQLGGNLYNSTQQTSYLKEALSLYEKNVTYYPNNAFAVMNVAQAYEYLKKYPQMLEHAEKAVSFPGLMVKQKITMISQYLTFLREYYEVSGDKALLNKMMEKIDNLKSSYTADFENDPAVRNLFTTHILCHRVFAECGLNMLEEAETDYARVPDVNAQKSMLGELLEKVRARVAPVVQEVTEESTELRIAQMEEPDFFEEEEPDEFNIDESMQGEILPYEDTDGWEALHLTRQQVVDYALGIRGPQKVPYTLAYLHAASTLNPEITPVYNMVALAADDPLSTPDYSITSLAAALENSDTDYATLNDCCMAAAFLRASFLSGRGYDYSVQGLRNSIQITQQIPSLNAVYDILEQFRTEAGRAVDIYADYRNHGMKKLKEDIDITIHHAEELYTKFILTPAREGVKFARLLETKKILFARDGYLATMLAHIINQDLDAMEAEKQNFVDTYLNGVDQFATRHVSNTAVDKLMTAGWETAGRNMQLKKVSADLQGDRRNNLRSNISEILATVCRWYALAEQGAGATWRTQQGVDAYQRLKPQLMERLQDLSRDCLAELESCPDPELCTGLYFLSTTALELVGRLDGSWKFDQDKYMYVDFLRSNHVMLRDDFMPELESTFCVLPDFNILARIRQHIEGPKLSFQEQIDLIYGKDRSCNNYGTADKILSYLAYMGDADSITLPENPERFLTYTEMQIDMRFRSFRETYALAMNYGQIIKSDAFCYTLEDTVRYWYSFCRQSKNYGFFTNILLQAENQIHASAQQYEAQLCEQLEALIAMNQEYFNSHPDYVEAIQTQITNQNFTVAEDWMARIRIGDFSLDVQQPEAIDYLEDFWNHYVITYNRVADASRTLSSLLGRQEVRNKDTKHAVQLIDSWPKSSSHSSPDKIAQLLNLLGWENVNVSSYHFPADSRSEIYEVTRVRSVTGMTTPLHPIAAFGSQLNKKPMYVVCLYGIYDCDRLYEKMRLLDVIDGNKVILLDYALGQADRRALARRLKMRESSLRFVNMVIDRVLIAYLSRNYNDNLINRILVATAMPFTYCQPYVVESVHTMPPEIFIGRRDELLKIEKPDGVNLIYGGRQLGKSALFKKALADLDEHEMQRAVLVDIKELGCADAARKISSKLIDLGITPDAPVTDDWNTLCRNIERRLRNPDSGISYFLLMLDEADAFIKDCSNCAYGPLVALKDVQQSLPERFKYVLAGLHNIVKFNRQVALGNNSVITHMPSLKITPFRTPEAEELLTVPLSYLGFSLPSKVTVSQILATCNYFPGLIQLYAKKLIESIRAADYAGYDIKKTPPYVVSDEHLRRVMADKEFVDQIHEKFEITLTLDQDQGSCYYPLTLLIGWMYNVSPSKGGYTAEDVLRLAKDLSVHPLAELDIEKIDALLLELQDLNILRSISSNSYLLASKNFRDLLGSDEEIFNKLLSFGGVTV